MQRQSFGKLVAPPRDKLLWPVLLAVIAGQLLAIWLLCSHQVRKAEVRRATLQVQQVAVADCLRYIPRATLNSCVNRVDPNSPEVLVGGDGGAGANPAGTSTPVPVNYIYR